jgi:hypothetical protein
MSTATKADKRVSFSFFRELMQVSGCRAALAAAQQAGHLTDGDGRAQVELFA